MNLVNLEPVTAERLKRPLGALARLAARGEHRQRDARARGTRRDGSSPSARFRSHGCGPTRLKPGARVEAASWSSETCGAKAEAPPRSDASSADDPPSPRALRAEDGFRPLRRRRDARARSGVTRARPRVSGLAPRDGALRARRARAPRESPRLACAPKGPRARPGATGRWTPNAPSTGWTRRCRRSAGSARRARRRHQSRLPEDRAPRRASTRRARGSSSRPTTKRRRPRDPTARLRAAFPRRVPTRISSCET